MFNNCFIILSIANASAQLFNVFLESQIASHTAAAALLFSQLLSIGCPCQVQPEVMISSAVSVLTDLTQVTFLHFCRLLCTLFFLKIMVKCPFKNGVLDGLLMLISQMLCQVKFFDLVYTFGKIKFIFL
jgi:fused-like protein